jgi:hypothetical protein
MTDLVKFPEHSLAFALPRRCRATCTLSLRSTGFFSVLILPCSTSCISLSCWARSHCHCILTYHVRAPPLVRIADVGSVGRQLHDAPCGSFASLSFVLLSCPLVLKSCYLLFFQCKRLSILLLESAKKCLRKIMISTANTKLMPSAEPTRWAYNMRLLG